ncbi:hypothetical protein ACIA78_34625 [Streptomyces xanthochromogenes]|uniref:hypothetical protein n=1 Tax=Streptomyces xanthochromogenes TaxID=67384 RepID=UPI00379B475B
MSRFAHDYNLRPSQPGGADLSTADSSQEGPSPNNRSHPAHPAHPLTPTRQRALDQDERAEAASLLDLGDDVPHREAAAVG